MKRKILLIVEGEKEEVRILGKDSHGLLDLIGVDCEIVPFANPIYELYELYKNKEYDDIVEFLRAEKGLTLDKGTISKNAFSSIYLIFDYEPHYQKYSDETIKEMMNVFDNETEMGKLYINYPMIESFYHFKTLPDPEFFNRKISLEEFNGRKYKRLVGNESCLQRGKNFTKKDLAYVMLHNYCKASFLLGDNSDDIDYMKLLEYQINLKNSKNQISVLSTISQIAIDYNFEHSMSVLESKLKEDFHNIIDMNIE